MLDHIKNKPQVFIIALPLSSLMARIVEYLSGNEERIFNEHVNVNPIKMLIIRTFNTMNARIPFNVEELKAFTQKSDAKGLWLVVFNWLVVIAAFLIPALWLNPLSIALCIILLANRQLGLAILMHECAHNALFKSQVLNTWLGRILCGAPVLADLEGYRRYHMQHHKKAGTTQDPDYPNYKNYPVSNISFARKMLRDFSGITGAKTLYAVLLMNAEVLNYDMSYQSHKAEKTLGPVQIMTNLWGNLWQSALIHLSMWAILYISGHGWLYALWWLSYLTVYMFFARIRNAAEHACVPDLLDKDPLLHTRTTYANWWERLSFAPNYVNYHMEHHLKPTIPCYHLAAFHRYLIEKEILNKAHVANSYIEVIKQLMGLPKGIPIKKPG